MYSKATIQRWQDEVAAKRKEIFKKDTEELQMSVRDREHMRTASRVSPPRDVLTIYDIIDIPHSKPIN